jgi:hypothetical protein
MKGIKTDMDFWYPEALSRVKFMRPQKCESRMYIILTEGNSSKVSFRVVC